MSNPIAVTGAFGVPCVKTRKVTEDDSGETTSTVSLRSFQWSWGPQSSEISVWAPQGFGWKGTVWKKAYLTLPYNAAEQQCSLFTSWNMSCTYSIYTCPEKFIRMYDQ